MTPLENQSQPWWRDKEILWLLLLVAAVYLSHWTALSIRGEESRWARVACESLDNGDWVVPRQQGQPFLSRPPLHSWLIAGSIWLRGSCDLAAIRLPSLLATLLTTLLVYAYGRTFLNRQGALVSALAFATMGQVLELGCRAETEAVYTLVVSASLLLWHYGKICRWSVACTWMLGYGLAALATLTKGPQAILYFGAVTTTYLLLRRDWRSLFHPGHLAGLLVFALILGAWLLPFVSVMGWNGVKRIVSGDVALRFQDTGWKAIVLHLLTYPVEFLICTLPWSLLLLFFFKPSLRSAVRTSEPLIFLIVCLAVTFPSCWFVPQARGRYLMPLYPCLALILGWIIVPITCQGKSSLVLGRRVQWAVIGLAAVVGFGYSGLVVPYIASKSHDAGAVVAEFQHKHQDCQCLVSFGPVWHQFAYHYHQPITQRPWPGPNEDLSDINYFCFDRWGDTPVNLPFQWETVAIIPGDRYRNNGKSHFHIILGRRTSGSNPLPTVQVRK